MNSTRFFLLLSFLLLVNISYSQGFKSNYHEVTYILPASTPFTAEFKSITIDFHGEEHLTRYGILTSDLIKNDFNFENFESKAENGDLHLNVFIGKPEYLGVQKETETKKEDNKEVKYFHYKGSVITPIHYQLRDGAREMIEEKIVYTATDHMNFYTKGFTSSRALESYWEESKNIVISKELSKALQKSVSDVATTLKDRFDDQEKKSKQLFFDLKKADKVNALFMNKAYSKIEQGLSANPKISDWSDDKKKEITELYERGLKFDYKDKNKRVVYIISAHNLSQLKFFWGDLDQAKALITKGLKAEKKKYEFNKLKEWYDDFGDRGKADAISSGNYTETYVDGSNSKLPGKKEASTSEDGLVSQMSQEKEASIDTLILSNKDTLIGAVTMRMKKLKGSGSVPMQTIGTVVIHPINNVNDELEIDPLDVIVIKHKNKDLYMVPTSMAGHVGFLQHFYEAIKSTEDGKVILFKWAYHESMPYHMNTGDVMYAIGKMKSDEPKILSISTSTRFLIAFNKSLGSEFENCPIIVRKTKAKEYKQNEESLIELLGDYDKCMN